MNELIAIFGIFSMLTFLMFFFAIKRWLYSWEGILIRKYIKENKGISTDDGDYASTYVKRFFLIFKTSTGKILKREVSQGRYNGAIVGAWYLKTRKSWDFKRYGSKSFSEKDLKGSFFDK